MNRFTNLFPITKTLRFELRPQGETLKYIKKRGIIDTDTERAKDYTTVKTIIDEYHKDFISRALSTFKINDDLLVSFFDQFCSSKPNIEDIQKIQSSLYNDISKHLLSQSESKGSKPKLFNKELICELLPLFEQDKTKLNIIKKFDQFTTYFKGFNENRKNIYNGEGKHGSIAYRLINENLKLFAQDILRFKKVAPNIKSKIAQLNNDFSHEINLKWAITDISLIFDIKFFNNLLTQGDIDLYNAILGAKVDEKNHIQGLNQYINLYNQQNKSKLPTLDVLYKQILSDKESLSWLPDKFENDNDAIVTLKNYCESLKENETLLTLQRILNYITEFDLNHIYISEKYITRLSKDAFDNWATLKSIIHQTNQGSYSIAELDKYITEYNNTRENEPLTTISEYFSRIKKPFNHYNECLNNAKSILDATHETNDVFDNEESTHIMRELGDSIISIRRLSSYVLGNGNETLKDDIFYGHLIPIADTLNIFSKIYDKMRNRATKKPYSTEKIKLNFNCSTLLDGWDKNKEKDNLCVILRKDGRYFLGIMDNDSKNTFTKKQLPNDGDYYEKMEYKQIPTTSGIGGFIRKCFGVTQKLGWNCPSSCLNSDGKIIIKDSEVSNNLQELIDCQKEFFNTYEKDGVRYRDFYNYKFADSSKYDSLKSFYTDVEQQSYKIIFSKISTTFIDSLVKNGELYLFEIYNKDFSPNSRGRKNLHTMYWEALFSEENLNELKYKLNGKAEIFYRKASLKADPDNPTHKKCVPVKLRSNEMRTKTFAYDLQKDKRFTTDKFLFHVPITLNAQSKSRETINNKGGVSKISHTLIVS